MKDCVQWNSVHVGKRFRLQWDWNWRPNHCLISRVNLLGCRSSQYAEHIGITNQKVIKKREKKADKRKKSKKKKIYGHRRIRTTGLLVISQTLYLLSYTSR